MRRKNKDKKFVIINVVVPLFLLFIAVLIITPKLVSKEEYRGHDAKFLRVVQPFDYAEIIALISTIPSKYLEGINGITFTPHKPPNAVRDEINGAIPLGGYYFQNSKTIEIYDEIDTEQLIWHEAAHHQWNQKLTLLQIH